MSRMPLHTEQRYSWNNGAASRSIALVSPSVNETRALFPAGDLPTWILHPEDLPFGEGIYYLRVVPKDGLESTSVRNLTVGIATFLAHCVFWDETQETWDNSGCQVRA